jgi:urate oxidase
VTHAEISYGKLVVPLQLVRGDRLLACDVSMEVLGQGFLAAYTEGDNRKVVATDTMKNVIQRQAHAYEGATLEGLLDALGRHFLTTYPDMEGLRLWAAETPFVAVSEKVFRRVDAEHAVAELELTRSDDGKVTLSAQRSGVVGFRVLKTTGSSFTSFARDEETTLPERRDRPLYIHLDVHWRYGAPTDAVGAAHVAPGAVTALLLEVHDTFVSESIQHLVHEVGQRLLAAFPALSEVAFRGENHTFDPVPGAAEAEPLRKTYTSPFPAWGLITLVLTR